MLPRVLGGGGIQSGGRRGHPLLPNVGESAAAAHDSAAKPGLHHEQGRRDGGRGQSAQGKGPPGGQAAVAPSNQGVRLGGIQPHLQVGFGTSFAFVS